MIKKIKRVIKTLKNRKDSPLHIEFNLTDFCNLNCKGCTHYSPLASAEYNDFDILESTMRHIGQIKNAEYIKEVFLIGGETLLYPKLIEAMDSARKYFQDAKISVFTNGLLLPKMPEEFWESCRRDKIVIAITRYPVKFDYDKAEKLCRENKVEVEVFGDRSLEGSFFRFPLDPEKRQNARISHLRCLSYGCITIENGKIFPCSQAACVGHLNRRLDTEFKWERGDYIPVEELHDAKQLLQLRDTPVPFCSYCRKIETVKYETSRRSPEEWI